MRNVLYRALGQGEDLDVDVYEVHLQANDRLVLCSDGLTRHVKPQEIAEVVLVNRDPDTASQFLIDLANMRGGEDNVSVIVVLVENDEHEDGANREDSTVELTPIRLSSDETVILKDQHYIESAGSVEDTLRAADVLADQKPAQQERTYETGGEGRDPRTPFQ
jgi:serine/threonine protein phosphatase PrpC